MSKPLNQDNGIEDRQKMVPPEMDFEPIQELMRDNTAESTRKPDKRSGRSDDQVRRKR